MYIKCLKVLRLLKNYDVCKEISTQFVKEKIKITKIELIEILKMLEERKLVRLNWIGTSNEPQKQFGSISSTLKGKHYILNLIVLPALKQIVVPVIVAAITTLVTMFISNSI